MTRVYVKRSAVPASRTTPHQRRANAAWLRAQLQGLRFTAAMREIPRAELIRILDALLAGDEQIRAEKQPTPAIET